MTLYSSMRGHRPITALEDLPDAVAGVRTVPSGAWKLGASITLPNDERLVLADGATLSGDEHTEHVIFGNVDGALVTFQGNGGAGRGRSPHNLSVVNAHSNGDGIHVEGTGSGQSFVSFKVYAEGGRYGICYTGTIGALVCSDGRFEGGAAAVRVEGPAAAVRIRDVRCDGADAISVDVAAGIAVGQLEMLRCVLFTSTGVRLVEADTYAVGSVIVTDTSGVTPTTPLVGVAETDARYSGNDNTAMPNSDAPGPSISGAVPFRASGRVYCYFSDLRWVTMNDDNYGENNQNWSEAAGTGVDPIVEWEHQGAMVPAGYRVNRVWIAVRNTNALVLDLRVAILKVAPADTFDWFSTGLNADSELDVTELHNDLIFNPVGGAPALLGATNHRHMREIDLSANADALFSEHGELRFYFKPTGVFTTNLYSQVSVLAEIVRA